MMQYSGDAPRPFHNSWLGEGYTGINPMTGNWLVDESINSNARRRGQLKFEPDGEYCLFDRVKFIEATFNMNKPVVITWVPSTIRLHCRCYRDIFGISDIIEIEEIPTLFTNVKGMENLRIFLIPYLVAGYDIPPEIDNGVKPYCTQEMVNMMKEIHGEPKYPERMT